MTLTQLRAFLAVVDHGSVRGAAAYLHLSQPAVTRQVQQLEGSLGIKLFDRVGRSIQPTAAADELYAEGQRLLGNVSRVVEKMARYRSPGHGRLRLGASTTPGLYVLPPIVKRFRDAYPEVELSYLVDNSEVILARLHRNEIDLGFVGEPPSEDSLAVELSLQDELVCVAHSGHAMATRRRVRFEQLAGETWIVREPGSATRRLFERWLQQRHLSLERKLELHHPEEVKALVRAGVGLSLISAAALRSDRETSMPSENGLVRLNISGLKLGRQILMVRHAAKHVTPDMQSFSEVAAEQWRER